MPGTDAAAVEVLDLHRFDGTLQGTRERISSPPGQELAIELVHEPTRTGFEWSVGRILRFRQSRGVSSVKRPIELPPADNVSRPGVFSWTATAPGATALAVARLPRGVTLASCEPRPTDARLLDDRLTLFWGPRPATITLRPDELAGSARREAKRWARRCTGGGRLQEVPGIRVMDPAPRSWRAWRWMAAGAVLVGAGVLLYQYIPPVAPPPLEPAWRGHAVVIGIDHYPSERWLDLVFAVRDAREVAGLLRGQGFEVKTFFDASATKLELLSYLEDDLAPRLSHEDRVLFYFAGHGYTQHLGGEQRGYIVPHDGQDQPSSYISMEKLRELSEKMSNAPHQLFLLDACFGGLIAGSTDSGSGATYRDVGEASRHTARQVLTAGGIEPVVDGESGFTRQLLRGIADDLANGNQDDYVTVSELARFMMAAADKEGPAPVYATLPGHDRGDFIFTKPTSQLVFHVTPETATILLRGALAPPAPAQPAAERMRGGVYSRVAPAVAFVRTDGGGYGTGFLVDETTVVTNHHVVADHWFVDPDKPGLFVELFFGAPVEGQMEPCHEEAVRGYVASVDKDQDLALLELDRMPASCPFAQPLALVDDRIDPEASCAMIGHPTGAVAWSVRHGNVMGRGSSPVDLAQHLIERLGLPEPQRSEFITRLLGTRTQEIVMTNILSNPGDSGGPLVDLEGRVIGVSCGILGETFAYHVDARQLQALLDSRTPGAFYVPDSHRFVTPRVMLHRSRHAMLSQPSSGEPDRFLLDLDGDTPSHLLVRPGVAEMEKLLDERQFDAEVAIHRSSLRSLVFYDTDDSSVMDLILVYENDGQSQASTSMRSRARYRLSRQADGSWNVERDPGNPWLDLAPISDDLRAEFSKWVEEFRLGTGPTG